jgi:hypothetical protein
VNGVIAGCGALKGSGTSSINSANKKTLYFNDDKKERRGKTKKEGVEQVDKVKIEMETAKADIQVPKGQAHTKPGPTREANGQ